jgi:hypothetical protein
MFPILWTAFTMARCRKICWTLDSFATHLALNVFEIFSGLKVCDKYTSVKEQLVPRERDIYLQFIDMKFSEILHCAF